MHESSCARRRLRRHIRGFLVDVRPPVRLIYKRVSSLEDDVEFLYRLHSLYLVFRSFVFVLSAFVSCFSSRSVSLSLPLSLQFVNTLATIMIRHCRPSFGFSFKVIDLWPMCLNEMTYDLWPMCLSVFVIKKYKTIRFAKSGTSFVLFIEIEFQ